MTSLPWVWATPPDDVLRDLARSLEDGVLPAGLEPVKAGRGRAVWRLPDVAGGLIVKHYRTKLKDIVKAWFLPWRAESEYRMMEAFCRIGLPTVRPVAFADRRAGGRMVEAWFLGRLVPDAHTVAELLERHRGDPDACWDLARRSLAVVAQLHEHPFFHRDLHAGNLLVDDRGEVLIIDLHSVWRVPWLLRPMRLENLARLLFSLRDCVPLDDGPALVREYAERRGEDPDALIRDVRRRLEIFERDYVRGRTRRCMLNSSEFVRGRAAEGRVHRRRSYAPEQLSADIARHHEIVAAGGDGLLGQARRTLVTRVDDGDDGARVVKQYVPQGRFDALRTALGLGRARTAWKAARRCSVHGIPTPRALALVEARDGSEYLVTEALPDSVTLEVYAASLVDGGEPRRRAAIAYATGHVVGRLARAGLWHHDLSTKNLLIGGGRMGPTGDLRTAPPRDLPDVQLIDLDNMRVRTPHSPRVLVRMLKQIGDLPAWVQRTDRQRFARGFARGAGRALPRAVVARAAVLTRRRQERRARLEAAARPPS